MTNEVKNVPELRFPNFEGEWEEKKLGDLVSIISGYSPSYYSIGGEYPLYKVNDLNNNNKYQIYSELYVSKKGEPTSNKTIIFPKRGAAILLNKIRIMITPGYIDTNLMGLQFEDINNTEFYYYTILKEGLFKIADTSTIPQINNKHILNYKINLPDNSERNKLGDFFNKLDQQIELEEQKLEKLEEQKKGYMQKIFSQQLRFKGENGNDYPEWKKEIIGNIATTFSGGTPSSTNSTFYTGEIPFIRSGEIAKTSTELMINEKAISNSSAKMVETGDLLYALYGATSGEVAISKINGAINQAVLCIRSQESIGYIFNYLKMKKDQILKTYIQGGQGNLSASIIKKVDIDLPSLEEQKLIGHFFNKFDDYIEIQSDKVELLKERKKGFLQKMFV
ncbi:restriction endonuclease subunit S [Staphylococcus xylosus]